MWAWAVIIGLFSPSVVTVFYTGDVSSYYYFGTLLALCALSYGIASDPHRKLSHRVVCTCSTILSLLWIADSASGFLFDVQVEYPWWAVIDLGFLFLIGLNSFKNGTIEPSGCFAYVRKPITFQDILATIFGGVLVTTAIEYRGNVYGFRKGKLIVLTDFDKTKYDRRNVPVSYGRAMVNNLGKPWRPWRNCVWIIGG